MFNIRSTFISSFTIFLGLIFSQSAFAEWNALNMTEGVTDISREVFGLHMFIFWIVVAIGVLVFGVMFYSMYAHTKKKNPEPASFHENTKLEILWTIIPFVILISMAVPATNTLQKAWQEEGALQKTRRRRLCIAESRAIERTQYRKRGNRKDRLQKAGQDKGALQQTRQQQTCVTESRAR